MTETGRRPIHIIGGVTVFGAGLFLALSNILYVVEFIKGGTQPILIFIGLAAAAAAIFNGPGSNRILSIIIAVVFTVIGCYGVYDEYYATMDFVNGVLPLLLIFAGSLTLAHGITRLKNDSNEK